jgi:predicted class III extradiol MEMO1 family dioxygenase
MGLKRTAAVAGSFYPDNPAELRRLIGSFVDPTAKALPARAVIAPHAGYMYSGAVAGAVYSSVILPEQVVILAPAHRPQKPVFAVMTEGAWETPLGTVAVASDLAEAILSRCPATRKNIPSRSRSRFFNISGNPCPLSRSMFPAGLPMTNSPGRGRRSPVRFETWAAMS